MWFLRSGDCVELLAVYFLTVSKNNEIIFSSGWQGERWNGDNQNRLGSPVFELHFRNTGPCNGLVLPAVS